jgi:hypothetical protein
MEINSATVEAYAERPDVKEAIEFHQKIKRQLEVQEMLKAANDNPVSLHGLSAAPLPLC